MDRASQVIVPAAAARRPDEDGRYHGRTTDYHPRLGRNSYVCRVDVI